MARQWEKMEGRPTKPVARSKVVRSSGLRPIKVIISIRPGLIKDWHVKRKYDDPATPGQIRYITMLAVKKGIREPIEERKMILGGAGMQIRGLQSLPDKKKNPTTEIFYPHIKEDCDLFPQKVKDEFPRFI